MLKLRGNVPNPIWVCLMILGKLLIATLET